MDLQNTGNAPNVEIVHCIKQAGLTPDVTDLTQLAGAVKLLGGLSREEIQIMINEAAQKESPYFIGEFYFFRHPVLRPGFQLAHGGLLENAASLYPEAWAYLQTAEGNKLCKTEEEWQAMTQATWATLADGTKIGWDGIGGAPFYAPDLKTGALRLPDIRGMYAEAAGFDSLGVGGVHGDTVRNAVGSIRLLGGGVDSASGVYVSSAGVIGNTGGNAVKTPYGFDFALAHVMPVGNKIAPRAYGVLSCVYLGPPK